MDFAPTEEQRLLLDSLRRFMEGYVLPLERELRLDRDVPPPPDLRRKVRLKSVEAGFFGLGMPEEVGGGGGDTVTRVLAYECANQYDTVFRGEIFGGPAGPNPILMACTPAQREQYLLPLMRGEITTCFALSEPEAGSHATALRTTASNDGDHWILNGRKHFITNAPWADYAMLFAFTDRDAGPMKGITCFLVDRDAPGVEFGFPMASMALSGHQGEIVLEEARIPKANVLGEVGEGFRLALRWINGGRVNIGAYCAGITKHLLDLSADYARHRKQFGKPIGAFQLVQAKLADMATELFALQSLLYRTAWMIDQGQDCRREASICKLYGSEVANRAADSAIQIHGGMGYMKEFSVERIAREVRAFRIFEGTSEIQRIGVAKDVLGW